MTFPGLSQAFTVHDSFRTIHSFFPDSRCTVAVVQQRHVERFELSELLGVSLSSQMVTAHYQHISIPIFVVACRDSEQQFPVCVNKKLGNQNQITASCNFVVGCGTNCLIVSITFTFPLWRLSVILAIFLQPFRLILHFSEKHCHWNEQQSFHVFYKATHWDRENKKDVLTCKTNKLVKTGNPANFENGSKKPLHWVCATLQHKQTNSFSLSQIW